MVGARVYLHHCGPSIASVPLRSKASRREGPSLAEHLDVGSLVYVRYRDHMLFRNLDPQTAEPIIQEAWGLLDHEDIDYIRLVVARYQEPKKNDESATKATGLVIVKETILEMHKVA